MAHIKISSTILHHCPGERGEGRGPYIGAITVGALRPFAHCEIYVNKTVFLLFTVCVQIENCCGSVTGLTS